MARRQRSSRIHWPPRRTSTGDGDEDMIINWGGYSSPGGDDYGRVRVLINDRGRVVLRERNIAGRERVVSRGQRGLARRERVVAGRVRSGRELSQERRL